MLREWKKKFKRISRACGVINDLRDGVARATYSQQAEDIVILSNLKGTRKGFYVDVGAHHPKRLSNTYLLYTRGWSGINIDPIPNVMKMFAAMRPRDINIEVGVARQNGNRTLYVFEEIAMTTMDRCLANNKVQCGHQIVAEIEVPVRTLSSILDKHCFCQIDLLNVDVEGLDLEVLQTNDWKKYRPRLICVEELLGENDPAGSWLVQKGYRRVAITGRSRIYRSE